MGILEKNRFKENIPFEVNDYIDEPIDAAKTVKEIFIADFESFKTFERESSFKTGSRHTLKAIQPK